MRFPIITGLRSHYDNAVEIVMATAVLHNCAVLWKVPVPDGDNPDADFPPIPPELQDGGQVVVVQEPRNRATIRAEGEIVRERLRENMPERTRAERRKMARRRD